MARPYFARQSLSDLEKWTFMEASSSSLTDGGEMTQMKIKQMDKDRVRSLSDEGREGREEGERERKEETEDGVTEDKWPRVPKEIEQKHKSIEKKVWVEAYSTQKLGNL